MLSLKNLPMQTEKALTKNKHSLGVKWGNFTEKLYIFLLTIGINDGGHMSDRSPALGVPRPRIQLSETLDCPLPLFTSRKCVEPAE